MLRKVIVAVLVLCLCLSAVPAGASPDVGHQMLDEEMGVLRIVNQERGAQGLLPLTSIPALQNACDIRADELPVLTSHTRPDETPWYTVLGEVGINSYATAGENIAAGYRTPTDVMVGWMNSDGHRANILNEAFAHIGIGYTYAATSSYKAYWVQLFMRGFDCKYTHMELLTPEGSVFPAGTDIDEMGIVAKLTCKSCGDCYLPVLTEYCSGLDLQKSGEQTLTVSCLDQTATTHITMEPEPTEPVPTEPEPTEPEPVENPFIDVHLGKYYYEPVMWALENGITAGATATTFNPDGDCTRGQIVTFLWRAAGCPEPTISNNPFTDVDSDDYYHKAVLWAVEKGITAGATETTFNPKVSCTRAQVVTFMYRAAGSPESVSVENPFEDVAEDKYYHDAVLWAAENGITAGTSATKFAPGSTCTRGQIVTFLYRGYAQ